MQTLSPMDIKIPSPYDPNSTELFDWENFLRDAFTKVNDMKIVGKTMIVNAAQFATLNDAISFAQANNGVVYAPKGNYTWSGGTYTQDVIIYGEEGTSIALTAPVLMGGSASLFLRNFSITNSQTGKAFGIDVVTRTGRAGIAYFENCDIVFPNVQTDWGMHFRYFDTVLFSRCTITAQQQFALRILQVDSTNRFFFNDSTLTSPAMMNPYGFYCLADLAFLNRSSFYNTHNYFVPQNTTPTVFVFDCYFEANYSNTSSSSTFIWLNFASGLNVSAFIFRSRFVNLSTERANVCYGIVADLPNLVVNGCYFENVTGVRTSMNSHFNDKIPSVQVLNSTFRNCFRRAMEVLFSGHVLIANNLIYTDASWDGLPNYTLDGFGEAIRLYVYRTVADNTLTNGWKNSVTWRVQNNTIKRYLKAGIRIMVDTGALSTRRVYTNIMLDNNDIELVNYGALLTGTTKTNYETTYGSNAWERGTAIVCANTANADASWVTYSVNEALIRDCYNGFYHSGYLVATLDRYPFCIPVVDMRVIRTASIAELYSNWSIYIHFYSAQSFNGFAFFNYYGHNNIYANNGIKSLFFLGGSILSPAGNYGSPDPFANVNSSVRLAFAGTVVMLTNAIGADEWQEFEQYEGTVHPIDVTLGASTIKQAGGFYKGFAVGRIPSKMDLNLFKQDGSSPTTVTVNTITYPAYQVTSTVGVCGINIKHTSLLAQETTRYRHAIVVGVVLSGVPTSEQVTFVVERANIFSNTFTQLGTFTVTGNGGTTTYTTTIYANDSQLTGNDLIRVRLNANPTAGSAYVVFIQLLYAERGI